MANPDTYNFTTGPTSVPDIGLLNYNGCVFGPLFETKVSGNAVKDNARRTVKLMEYSIMVDGYVTAPGGGFGVGIPQPGNGISTTMDNLYKLLTAQGGTLIYRGRALDLAVNVPTAGSVIGGGFGVGGIPRPRPTRPGATLNNNTVRPSPNNDVAWGPVPEMLEFQPLGGGLSAKISWKVTVRLPALSVASITDSLGILQLNYDTTVSYDEAGFSSLAIKGTIEIPMTRIPLQTTRTVPNTVDSFRSLLEERILRGVDLSRFRVTKRNFNISRDKRTMEWDVLAEERPYMDIPPDCTVARGNYSVRPAKAGPGLVMWLCTLRATYTVRSDRPRRSAWWAFLFLLRLRMQQAELTPIPAAPSTARDNPGFLGGIGNIFVGGGIGGDAKELIERAKAQRDLTHRAWLIDFSFDEGLYLDSKIIAFSATWRMTARFSHILIASGLWRKPPWINTQGENMWAASMRDVQGSTSWLSNKLDPSLDVIVDFGSTGV